MSEINDLLAKIAEPETPEERDAAWNEVADRLRLMEAMHKELNALCDWGDESFMHAYAHIGNVIKNLRADVRTEKILREKAEADYAFMVKKAADRRRASSTQAREEAISEELARRAVACKGWRWLPGMRCTHRWTGGIRVLADEDGEQSEAYVVLPDEDGNAVMTIDECGIMGGFPDAGSAYPFLPDLDDPATVGCLLALVREAWEPRRGSDYIASTMHTGAGWGVGARYGSEGLAAIVPPTYDTEAAALVAALEAAP